MRYYEILTEGRDAPLYHWMEGRKVINTLSSDKLEARVTHSVMGMGNVTGVSLSRSKRFTFGDRGEVRLPIDQSKLQQRYKIVPLDGEAAFRKMRDLEPGTTDRGNHARQEWVFAEEFVLSDIMPLHHYVTEIFIKRRTQMAPVESYDACEAFADKWNIPLVTDPSNLKMDIDTAKLHIANYKRMNPKYSRSLR